MILTTFDIVETRLLERDQENAGYQHSLIFPTMLSIGFFTIYTKKIRSVYEAHMPTTTPTPNKNVKFLC